MIEGVAHVIFVIPGYSISYKCHRSSSVLNSLGVPSDGINSVGIVYFINIEA